MNKVAVSLVLLSGFCVGLVSCSNYNNSSSGGSTGSGPAPSRTKFRAFISNALHPTGTGTNLPALEIMNATTDQLVFSPIALRDPNSSPLPDVGPLDLAVNKKLTLAYSPTSNSFALVNNATEKQIIGTASLPGPTESFFIAQDNLHAYAAVPTAPILGQQSGAVIQIDLTNGNISATLPVPHVRFVVQAGFGGLIVALSDEPGATCPAGEATIITASNIGTATDPRSSPKCFDHPVGAALAPGQSTALIFECGPECGGAASAITSLNLSDGSVGTPIPVKAATAGFIVGFTLYVAGTPLAPDNSCSASSPTTLASTCGVLTILDLSGLNPTRTFTITDGYHTRLQLTEDGQLFIGSKDCTNLTGPAPGEIRGCLTVFDTTKSTTVFPAKNGDVTGMAPISGRPVVYVIEGRELTVFDTTTDKPLPNHQTNIVGELVDVKAVDNPVN